MRTFEISLSRMRLRHSRTADGTSNPQPEFTQPLYPSDLKHDQGTWYHVQIFINSPDSHDHDPVPALGVSWDSP